MKKIAIFAAFFVLAALKIHAQVEFFDGKMWVTAQERLRLEYRKNNSTFDSAIKADEDWYLLQRARLGVGGKPWDWFAIYGELQDAREISQNLIGVTAKTEEGRVDWRQGWLELGNAKEFPITARIGRQELSYGEERLIGKSDWSNVGRVFDAVKLRWETEQGWLDFFAANVVNNNSTGSRFGAFDDKADWADDFYGLYGHFAGIEALEWEGYALFRDKTDAVFRGAARQLFTLGTRMESTKKLAPWDFHVEFAGQFGHVSAPGGQFGELSSAWASHEAFMGVIGGGYTFDHEWKPRLGLEYNYASGDRDPTDGKSETFDNLFSTAHRVYGFIDLVAPKNAHDARATFSLRPWKDVRVQFDGHFFWLAESRDAWYRSNGSVIRRDATGGSGTFLGSEIDVTVTYSPHKRVQIQTGYSHFFAGSFVKDTGPSSDASFFYTQLTLNL
jgi:hypothetical protein